MIKQLSEKTTWDDIMFEIFVRKKTEAGVQASDEGRSIPYEVVKNRFLR